MNHEDIIVPPTENNNRAVAAPSNKRKATPFRGGRGKSSRQNRQDSYRKAKSEQFVKDLHAKHDSKMAEYASCQDRVLERIKDSVAPVTKHSAQLSISTRGLGASVAETYSRITAAYPKLLRICSAPQMYRIALLQASYRLQLADRDKVKPTLGLRPFEDLFYAGDISDLLKAPRLTGSLIANVLNGIGWFEIQQCSFWTCLERSPFITDIDDDGNEQQVLAEDAAMLLTASNIRDVINYLVENADDSFLQMNPIPGADWSDAGLLENGDELFPADWLDRSALKADFTAVDTFFSMARVRFEYLVTDYSITGKAGPQSLISRIYDSIDEAGSVTTISENRYSFAGSVGTYFSAYSLDASLFGLGVLSMLGECHITCVDSRTKSLAVESTTVDIGALLNRVLN
jgi:hypothetical protein